MAKIHLLLLLLAVAVAGAKATLRQHTWEIAYRWKSPDCFKKQVITVNGHSPGPTIFAEKGDNISINLTNNLPDENTTIHWHGIRQIGTPWSDGMGGVTQCPILPGKSFTYEFVVDRAGTYIYHSHSKLQRSDGLYGFIIVSVPKGDREPFSYDFDESILLSDWWHKSARQQLDGLLSIPFVWVNEPQSLLINGMGSFNCTGLSSDKCNASNPDCSPFVLPVKPGKTYRLRIASIASLSSLNFQIEGHSMTVVETDGHYVEPFVETSLNIYSGETYSVLVTADGTPSRNYFIAVNVVGRKPNTTTGQGIFNYEPVPPRKVPHPSSSLLGPLWNDTESRVNQSHRIRARTGHLYPPPQTYDRRIILLNTQNEINGYKRWSLNNISLTIPNTPYLVALKSNQSNNAAFDQSRPPDTYDYESYDIRKPPPIKSAEKSDTIYRLEFNSTVDVVLQNANTLNPNDSETHPWHLHGHDFWVLGYGEGKFDPEHDPKRFNLKNPIMRNTVPLHPYGWTAIRFKADNPGVWAFHCHISSHFNLGMGVIFEEGVEKVPPMPPAICSAATNHPTAYHFFYVTITTVVLVSYCVLLL